MRPPRNVLHSFLPTFFPAPWPFALVAACPSLAATEKTGGPSVLVSPVLMGRGACLYLAGRHLPHLSPFFHRRDASSANFKGRLIPCFESDLCRVGWQAFTQIVSIC